MSRSDELLIQRVFDRDVSETEIEQLEARLRDDPELRQLYYQYAQLDHVLCEEFTGRAHLHERLRSLRNAPPLRANLLKSVLSAAAILLALAAAAYFVGVRPSGSATLVSYGLETKSALVHLDGKSNDGQLRKGSRLVLERGTVQLVLPSGVRALVEGPATVEGQGRNSLRLESGRAWFQVPEGAEGFTCSTPALEIVDLGTEFGIIAAPGDRDEVHVLRGTVRVHPRGRPAEFRELGAGESLAWSGAYFAEPSSGSSFATRLPRKLFVLSDDFSDPDDTTLHRKAPDVGAGPWIVTKGSLLVRDGVVDTAGEPCSAFAPLDTSHLDGVAHILLLTVETAEPDTRAFHSAGWAGISLFADSEERVFIGDPFGPGTRWALQPFGAAGTASEPPLREKQVVTVRYDFRTGLIEMFQGHDSRGQALASTFLAPGLRFDQVRIGNGEGGDLAVRLLRASVLVSDESK